MSITDRPPDIEAEISFVLTEQGGRKLPAFSGYRPNHNFGIPGTLNDAVHEYINSEAVAPGQTVKANMWFLTPEFQHGRLYKGFTFTVQEGSRIVGKGVVTNVINPLLRHRT